MITVIHLSDIDAKDHDDEIDLKAIAFLNFDSPESNRRLVYYAQEYVKCCAEMSGVDRIVVIDHTHKIVKNFRPIPPKKNWTVTEEK